MEKKDSVEILNVSNNKFTRKSGKRLADALEVNKGLVTLFAGFNDFSESTTNILDSIYKNQYLKKLYLENTVSKNLQFIYKFVS